MDNVKDILVELELSLHTKEVRSSRAALNDLLADEFREIGASGMYFGKQEVLDDLPEEDGITIEATDIEFRQLSSEVAHITYRADFLRTNGKLLRTSYRTSVWKFNGLKWQMVFHQGTATERKP